MSGVWSEGLTWEDTSLVDHPLDKTESPLSASATLTTDGSCPARFVLVSFYQPQRSSTPRLFTPPSPNVFQASLQ